MNLPEKIVALHQRLAAAGLPHAFGGALALAWCTQRARGTIDIDINIFVGSDHCETVFAALPQEVSATLKQRRELQKEGQVRLWWEQTPVDVFLNTTDFHEQAARRVRLEQFMGHSVPFLACGDLAVLKAFFNRTQDWADLEAMQAAGTLNVDRVSAVLIHYLGADDERIDKLQSLRPPEHK
ncbi:hypothetical protein F6455_01495 [Proteobacteria bacterium 005FR1]|nr:hypothetical protein [Proteobacteria bacterium 005FR1]